MFGQAVGYKLVERPTKYIVQARNEWKCADLDLDLHKHSSEKQIDMTEVLQIVRLIEIAICDSNRESHITSLLRQFELS